MKNPNMARRKALSTYIWNASEQKRS